LHAVRHDGAPRWPLEHSVAGAVRLIESLDNAACRMMSHDGHCSSDSNKTTAPATECSWASGGHRHGDGVQVVIPPGALDHDVRITAASGGTLPTSYTSSRASILSGPDGTAFLKPVDVSFDLAKAGVAPTGVLVDGGRRFTDAHGVVSGTKIRRFGDALSQGFVARPRWPRAEAAESAWQ